MFDGRFFLGVGTGENLNEHIVGRWLAVDRRAPGDARGSGRGDPPAVEGRADRAIAAATTWSRTRGSTACRRSRRPICSPPAGRRAPSSPAASATGSSAPSPDAETMKIVRARRRPAQAALRRAHRVLGRERGEGEEDRAQGLADRRRSRARCTGSCRCRRTSRRRSRT